MAPPSDRESLRQEGTPSVGSPTSRDGYWQDMAFAAALLAHFRRMEGLYEDPAQHDPDWGEIAAMEERLWLEIEAKLDAAGDGDD